MTAISGASAGVERARHAFVADGACRDDERVAAHILRSWGRSRALRAGDGCAGPVSNLVLAERKEAAELLWRCAQPELDALAEHAVPQGCVVILSDAAGMILDEVGSADFLPKAERVALLPGVDWSEAQRGTNAIGTAMAEREAVLVLGPEHFLPQNGLLGCAAAPILDARGGLAGVLDISGEALRVDGHAMGLVRIAAAQVEHRMMARSGTELIRFHWRPGLLGTAREGLVAVAEGRIVGLNRMAVQLLGGGWSGWLDAPVDRLFGDRWARLFEGQGLFLGPDGRQWAAMGDAGGARRARSTVRSAGPAAVLPSATSVDIVEESLRKATRVLAAGLPVLVHGETGSGKEWFARRLHAASARASGPFVAINCGALPESLIEAELFGYEDGAFTGARRRGQPGRIREAHGGILFLDEIGDMPLALQTRLLRVLEDGRVRPLGGLRDIAVDFALVCASHRDLAARVREGLFREDLLFRLNGFLVALPPLRERADRHRLIQDVFERTGAPARGIRLTPAAVQALARRPWPGNVRELASTLRQIVALAGDGDVIDAGDLPAQREEAPAPIASRASADDASLAGIERRAFEEALAQHGGRIAPAARALGVHRSTIYRWLQGGKHPLQSPR